MESTLANMFPYAPPDNFSHWLEMMRFAYSRIAGRANAATLSAKSAGLFDCCVTKWRIGTACARNFDTAYTDLLLSGILERPPKGFGLLPMFATYLELYVLADGTIDSSSHSAQIAS